ncbi:sugar ABC transporter permease [Microbacterium sp. H1-D42]|uniref:carbohydrate ABC transporter permease n=1 Tax=Microbacterium sp. H1-D42 TaxID=2925844 RepID=UPI001F52F457|nr:sugar ABC transporter permease [Microbacterium sp. H1-D42]UNK70522.1 sugar ABC transporter permease [Microbacterium sp. H1-D42]
MTNDTVTGIARTAGRRGFSPARGRVPARRRPISARLLDGALTLPALAIYIVLMVVPVGYAVYYSFTTYNGIPSQSPTWVGLDNYRRIFEDPANEMHSSVMVTATIAIVGSLLVNAIALGLALLLQRKSRFNSFGRAVMFYPHVLSALIVGFLWQALLGPQGAINALMETMMGSRLPFLSDPTWALWTLIGVIVWAQFGVQLVLYIAGLQAVSVDLLEAARIDGASRFQVFRHVTWPALASTVTVTIITSVLSLLKAYDVVLGLTNGGPGGATQTWAYEILAVSFPNNKVGLASAQAVLLIIAAGILSFSIIAMRRKAESGSEAVG